MPGQLLSTTLNVLPTSRSAEFKRPFPVEYVSLSWKYKPQAVPYKMKQKQSKIDQTKYLKKKKKLYEWMSE